MQTPPSGDDLDKPLGTDRPHARERDIPYVRLALLGVTALALSLGAFVYVTSDPDGAQPLAVAPIAADRTVAAPVPPPAKVAAAPADAAGEGGDTTGSVRKFSVGGAEIEDRNGVKVRRSAGAGGSGGALIIQVPEALSVRLASAPDKRLIEKSEYGILPKVGADGARPADVYARRVVMPKELPSGAPRIAVMVGDMGRDPATTAQAIEKLPQEVTLAFVAQSADLPRQAAAAREEGHEILLQAPMETTAEGGGARADKTLLVSAPSSRNVERLHWMMGRFAGYVGVANALGDKFMSDAEAMRPLLRDIADRGLFFADDGSASRSSARTVASEAKVPFVGADVVLDAGGSEDVDAALARLEGVARTRGFAVGSAVGRPETIARIEAWARRLEGHGVALVPLSAMAARARTVSTLPSPER